MINALNIISVAALLGVVTFFSPPPGGGELLAVHDAGLGEFNASNNSGTATTLVVQRETSFGDSWETVIRFPDVSGIDTSGTVELVLTAANGNGDNLNLNIYHDTYDSWIESTVTWNNYSGGTETLIESRDATWDTDQEWRIDVKAEIIAAQADDDNFAVIIRMTEGNGPTNLQFYSSEHASAATKGPRLVWTP